MGGWVGVGGVMSRTYPGSSGPHRGTRGCDVLCHEAGTDGASVSSVVSAALQAQTGGLNPPRSANQNLADTVNCSGVTQSVTFFR